MRLTTQQLRDIVRLTHEHVHQQAKVWLFGSRVDDNARGGDIDLYIETPAIEDPGLAKIRLRLAFEDAWGSARWILYCISRLTMNNPSTCWPAPKAFA